MYSHQHGLDQMQPPPPLPAPPTIMHQLVDNVSGPLYHQQQVTTTYPPTTNIYQSPLPPLAALNMTETPIARQGGNNGYAHHPSQPHLPAEPIPSTTNTPTTPMTIPQLAEFAATMTYFLWHVRKSSVMALHSASSQGDLAATGTSLATNHTMSQQQPTNPAFQRFCQQILTATQVSESVVLLALKYIAKLLQKSPNIQGAEGSEYRLFIVAILLANKFHDDNTFTNKTWSDISGMKLHELDIMELEFLNVLDFCLFVGKEEFDHWKTGLFGFMLQNTTAMQEQQQMMDATLRSMGLFLPAAPDAAVTTQPYLFSSTAQPDLLQIQLNTPVTRVPLRIPSYPVYMSSASSSIHSTPTSHAPYTPINNMYPQAFQPNSNPASYASTPHQYAHPTSLTTTSSCRPLPRNASTPSLSAWAQQGTRSTTTPIDHHHSQHPHHHHHHHQRAYRPYQRPATNMDHQQPLVDYYAWKSLTQGGTPSPHTQSSHRSTRRRSYSNPFPLYQQQQQMLKPYAHPRQQASHDSNYQDYQQIGADPSRLQHDQQQQQQQYQLNSSSGPHH